MKPQPVQVEVECASGCWVVRVEGEHKRQEYWCATEAQADRLAALLRLSQGQAAPQGAGAGAHA
jgi:hypothetical protein